jgi:hypothetical protein
MQVVHGRVSYRVASVAEFDESTKKLAESAEFAGSAEFAEFC